MKHEAEAEASLSSKVTSIVRGYVRLSQLVSRAALNENRISLRGSPYTFHSICLNRTYFHTGEQILADVLDLR